MSARLGVFMLFILVKGGAAQVAVIAHKSVPADSITRLQLLDFYTGDIKRWGDKSPVVVLDLKPKGDSRTTFYEFLGKTSSRMKSIWLKKMLAGEGEPPEAVTTEEEMLNKIAMTPGSVGFVRVDKLNEQVKTLLIIVRRQD